MSTLKKRLIFSAIFVSVTVYTIFFSPQWFFFLVITAFALVGFHEYMELSIQKGVTMNRVLAVCVAALIPIGVAMSKGVMAISLATLIIFVYQLKKEHQANALKNSAMTVFGMLYVVLFFSQFLRIRDLMHGPELVFYTILIVKGGDAGAYFTGRKIGKTKLIEHISPNKSVEGAIGGFLTTVGLSLISVIYLPEISMGHLLLMGILVGILSPLGDLAESLLKRDAGIKDSGQIPGLGGILDMLDSLLLTAPFVYFYLTWLNL